jgi:hypothetical protein
LELQSTLSGVARSNRHQGEGSAGAGVLFGDYNPAGRLVAIKELRGFERITLQPKEPRTVRMTVKGAELTYWDAGKHSLVVEPGRVSIMLGASSARTCG